MSLAAKLGFAALLALLIAVFGYGWHIRTVYAGYVASTDQGDALFPRETLERYGAQLEAALRADDVQLAIVSRSGQKREKLPPGVMFTHSAFFRRNPAGGYDVYNLYHGEEDRLTSSLVTDTPADFLRLLQERDAGLLIPTPAMQARLHAFLISPDYAAVHQPAYSLISNPLDLRYQNCNEFMLYAVASAVWDTTEREVLRERIAEAVEPTVLDVSPVRRHFGPMIDERLILDDHGDAVQTTTFQTLVALFGATGALHSERVLAFADDQSPRTR